MVQVPDGSAPAFSVVEGKLRTVQGGKIIHGGLGPADQLEGAVLMEQHLRGAELAVDAY